MADKINPPHYKGAGGLEVIDVIEAFGLQNDYYLATALKYILRAGKKTSSPAAEDIAKAIWFLERFHVKSPAIPTVDGAVRASGIVTKHGQHEFLADGVESGRE